MDVNSPTSVYVGSFDDSLDRLNSEILHVWHSIVYSTAMTITGDKDQCPALVLVLFCVLALIIKVG